MICCDLMWVGVEYLILDVAISLSIRASTVNASSNVEAIMIVIFATKFVNINCYKKCVNINPRKQNTIHPENQENQRRN